MNEKKKINKQKYVAFVSEKFKNKRKVVLTIIKTLGTRKIKVNK